MKKRGDCLAFLWVDPCGSTTKSTPLQPQRCIDVGYYSFSHAVRRKPPPKNRRPRDFSPDRCFCRLFHGFSGDGKLDRAGDIVASAAGKEYEDGRADRHDADGGPIGEW